MDPSGLYALNFNGGAPFVVNGTLLLHSMVLIMVFSLTTLVVSVKPGTPEVKFPN